MQGKQSQNLKQSQRLIMSPQMQQAIYLLQLPTMELDLVLQGEMEKNPILEYFDPVSDIESDASASDEKISSQEELNFESMDFRSLEHVGDDYGDWVAESGSSQYTARTREEDKLKLFQESSLCSHANLPEYLMRQAYEIFVDDEDRETARVILGYFDDRGFLDELLETIAAIHSIEVEYLESVLKRIQTLEPFGVGARTVQECLMIQLRCLGKTDFLAYRIVSESYDDLIHNRIPQIAKRFTCSSKDIQEAIDCDIRILNLRPRSPVEDSTVHTIVPDVFIRRFGDQLQVEIDGDTLPSIRINPEYLKLLEDESTPKETREYIRHHIGAGRWLVRNLDQRSDTLRKISEIVVSKQHNFLTELEGQLVPLTMKSVAEELGIHESTVARAVANKYVDCDRGLLTLRSFFSNAYVTDEGSDISSNTVKSKVFEIIRSENKKKPLSDENISQKLKEEGITCARRTIAKYRRELNIGNASQRKLYS